MVFTAVWLTNNIYCVDCGKDLGRLNPKDEEEFDELVADSVHGWVCIECAKKFLASKRKGGGK